MIRYKKARQEQQSITMKMEKSQKIGSAFASVSVTNHILCMTNILSFFPCVEKGFTQCRREWEDLNLPRGDKGVSK